MTISKILSGLLLLGCCVLGYMVFRQKEELSNTENNAKIRVAELERELNTSRESLKLLQGQHADNQNPHTPPRRISSSKPNPKSDAEYRLAISSTNTLNLLRFTETRFAETSSPYTVKEIKSILGSDAPNTLNQIKSDVGKAQAQVMMESQVRGLSSDFSDANAPLNKEQSDGLVQALLNGFYWQGKDIMNRPVSYNDIDSSTGLSLHDNANINNAAQVLNPEQLKIFQNYSIEMEKIYAIQRQYNLSLSP